MSLQNRALTWALRRWIKPKLCSNQEDLLASRALSARVPFRAKLAPGWRIRPSDDTALAGEWIEPAAPAHRARHGCILYFHGGGYVAMSPRTHRSLTSRLATWSDVMLFALDYRLAPEHPFPAALADAVAAYRALTVQLSPQHIVLGGDSAGGGLALATLLALRDEGATLPAAAVLFSPWTDLAATGASIVANAETDPLLRGSYTPQLAKYYLGNAPATDPLASPVYADLARLPPLFLQVGDTEMLLDDSRRIFANARGAGVEATLQIWRNVPHGWQVFAPVLPEARAALRQASAFIAGKLAPGPDQILHRRFSQ
jgi:epsilon-lactone hydrolase